MRSSEDWEPVRISDLPPLIAYLSLGPAVDWLFLGRFAHDTRALAQVVTEVITSGQRRIATLTSSKEQI